MLFNLIDYLQLLFISCDLKQLKNKYYIPPIL